MTFATKPVVRETAVISRTRPLVARLGSRTLTLHEKGRSSTRVEVTLEAIYQLGWKIIDRERRAAKRKAR